MAAPPSSFKPHSIPAHRIDAAARDLTRAGLPVFASVLGTYYLFLCGFHALFAPPTNRVLLGGATLVSAAFYFGFYWVHRTRMVPKPRVWGWVIAFSSVVIANVSLYQVVSQDPRNVLNFALVNVVAGVLLFSRPVMFSVLAVNFAAWAGIGATSESGTPLYDLSFLIGTMVLAGGLHMTALRALHRIELLRLSAEMALDRAQRRQEQRNRARKASERSRQGLYELMGAMKEGVLVVQNGLVVSVNRSLIERLSWDKDALLRKPLTDLVYEADHPLADPDLLVSEGSSGVEIRLLDKNGRPVEFDVRCSAVDYQKSPAVLLICHEVREGEEDKALLANRMMAVGTLAAGVAHEINNPLAYVVANLEMLQIEVPQPNSPQLERVRHLSDVALEGALRVRDIVTDLKNFSRSDASVPEPVDIHESIETAIRLSWNEIRHRATLLREYGHTPAVLANRARLGQVFLNLLVNAAQAIDEGQERHREIRIRTFSRGGEAQVEIADTGCGMSPALLERIFTPFFTTKPVGVGTGLGLPYCDEVITQLGGNIAVDSQPGIGTTIRISLPGTDLRATPSMSPAATPPTEAEANRPSRRVLVIDDVPELAAAIVDMLAFDEVVVAHSGAEGIRALDEGTFDCILCDVMVPDISGPEIYRIIEERWAELTTRVAFITGGSFTPDTQSFMEETDRPVLLKPFRAAELRELVDRVGG